MQKIDKIQHPFVIFKTTRKLGIESNFLHQVKAIYGKLNS